MTLVHWSTRLGGGCGLWIGDAHELADALVIEQTGRTIRTDVNCQASVESKSLRVQHLKTRAAGQLDGERLEGGAADESA